MRVKFAAQIFSKTVAAAIRTASMVNIISSSTAPNTANFIESINNVFDNLNSRTIKDSNPMRCPLSCFQKCESLKSLQMAGNYFNKMQVSEGNRKRNNIYCIQG